MTRARLVLAALWFGSLVALWLVVRSDRPAPAVPPSAPATRALAPVVSCPSVDAIAAAVRRVLPATAASPGAVEARPPADAAPPADDDDAVFLAALAALDDDLADGRWSEGDRDRLGAALARVTRLQAEELLAVVVPRLNEGTVINEIDGPPL